MRSRRLRREVNERIVELTKRFALDRATDPPMTLICECGRDDCMTYVEMRLPEYEAAQRAVPERWLVLSAHINPSADSILARQNGYALIHHSAGRLSTEAQAPRKESTSPATTDLLQL